MMQEQPSHSLLTEMQSRTKLLLGDKGICHLAQSHVLIVGVGGVGGAVAHMLTRAGVGALTLVDGDKVGATNLNRQMVAYTDTIGLYKTEALACELKRINPELQITLETRYLEVEDILPLLSHRKYDFVADAIDTLASKTELISTCHMHKIPIISAMGAGAKLDPLALRVDDISKTYNCSLARVVRKNLRARGIHRGVKVVFSEEQPNSNALLKYSQERGKSSTVGTVSYLPNIFGCVMAAHIIKKLSHKE